MIIVLDTSAAMDVLLSNGEFELYKNNIEKADAVIAPEIYISEISNVAWKYRKFAGFAHNAKALTISRVFIGISTRKTISSFLEKMIETIIITDK